MNLFANVESEHVSASLIAPMRGVQRARYVAGDYTPFHSADYFHAILCLSGEAVFQEQGADEFVCRAGTFFAIPAGLQFKWRIVKETLLLQCLHGAFSFIEHRGLANLFGPVNKRLFHFELPKAEFDSFGAAMDACANDQEPIKGLKLSVAWLNLMVLATAQYDAGDKSKHPALVKAMNHLVANSEREVSLTELSRKAGMGVSRLSQLFRENVGVSPLKYHATLRAERATNMILIEGLSACEIAERLGFASTSAFRRFYKRETGAPPGRIVNRKRGI